MNASDLLKTPLHALHEELGARMVPFAGYAMPVQYPSGILHEHHHCRTAAGLFDVSHMGQLTLRGTGDSAAEALETLVTADLLSLKPGRQRYALLTNDAGGVRDDLMVLRRADHLALVVNAACKDADFEYLKESLPNGVVLTALFDRALLALQGPAAGAVMERLDPKAAEMIFMDGADLSLDGIPAQVTRSGYTGEDGFEISVESRDAEKLARRLLAEQEVAPIGLGARDSLRLEAGLCLYGHDIDTGTSPVEADLVWAIGKRRRREGGFPGADRILRELKDGTQRVRVGLKIQGRQPAREGAEIADNEGRVIGRITSGGFGPTVGAPVAMGYVDRDFAEIGTVVHPVVRGKPLQATVSAFPMVEQRYRRKG
ncbi:MAG: glycine cleavage system aminomethyltransferase GcvT [Alphaproteobacteria bacterium]|nr:glycine cleavage system aminomethyltransferase GcvT [Alphaproteobacteria bacterium]